jgi:hypothetical protein
MICTARKIQPRIDFSKRTTTTETQTIQRKEAAGCRENVFSGWSTMANKREQPPLTATVTVTRVTFEDAERDPELRRYAAAQREFWQRLAQMEFAE